jgi:tetratricopeptide (TPR) repeat protein
MCARSLSLIFVCALAPAVAGAHAGSHARIEALTLDLERRPGDARLWIERASEYLVDGDPVAALCDLDRVEALAPRRAELPLLRGSALLDLGRAAEAEEQLTRAIARAPAGDQAYTLRARARLALGRAREAAADFERSIALSTRPSPDQFIDWSRALARSGAAGSDGAIDALDRGLAALGPSVSLIEEAVRLECAAGEYEAALERIERHASAWGSSAARRARRGDVLRAAGREVQAQAEYTAALAELEARPHRASTRPGSLENRLHAALRQGPPETIKP